MKKLVLIIIGLILVAGFASAEDLRAVKLKKFLDRYSWSPLRGHEQEILYCADKFGLDYRLYIAIAGAESSYGKRFPKSKKNLTGYLNGETGFDSIWQNIYETSKLIGTAHYYKKYRKTKDIKDLIYVYKGVPPYDHYYKNMRYALDKITAVSIAEELKEQRTNLARLDPASKNLKLGKQEWLQKMFSWIAVRYDKLETGKEGEAGLKFTPNES
ncbi:MAG: hypothetical protein ABIH22_03455 [Candidatus Margulisiibacteriota bacterium]